MTGRRRSSDDNDAVRGDVPTPIGHEAWSAPPVVRVSRRNAWIAGISGGVIVLLLGVWLVIAKLPQLLSTPTDGSPAPTASATPGDGRRIQATIYYVSSDGSALVATTRAVLYGGTAAEQARHIVEAILEPPPEGQASAVPVGTTVRSVFLTGTGQAYVDLGGAIVSGHTGGSLDEALTVYAIVNALTVNLPGISAVQILVEGQQVDTLVGHLDLRYPLSKAPDWVRKGP